MYFLRSLLKSGRSLAGAISFYTCLPIPLAWMGDFTGVCRWATFVGLLMGGILGLTDICLEYLHFPMMTRSALVVVGWMAITGGLHLDGAMDTADGLAVQDPQRRLQVMMDSATGAFGAMAAIAILLLKTTALSNLAEYRWLALMLATGWGRWGQVLAIAYYPYLKPTGKGAFHKDALRKPLDICIGLLLLLGLSGLVLIFFPHKWEVIIKITWGGGAIAIVTGAWFNSQLGGHTGDTYGAVVEWTEALLLCLITSFN